MKIQEILLENNVGNIYADRFGEKWRITSQKNCRGDVGELGLVNRWDRCIEHVMYLKEILDMDFTEIDVNEVVANDGS